MRLVQHGLAQPSIGWPEKSGWVLAKVRDDLKALPHFLSCPGCADCPGVAMTEGMAAYGVAFVEDTVKQSRIALAHRADDKKIRMHTDCRQRIQQAGCIYRIRPVVEA